MLLRAVWNCPSEHADEREADNKEKPTKKVPARRQARHSPVGIFGDLCRDCRQTRTNDHFWILFLVIAGVLGQGVGVLVRRNDNRFAIRIYLYDRHLFKLLLLFFPLGYLWSSSVLLQNLLRRYGLEPDAINWGVTVNKAHGASPMGLGIIRDISQNWVGEGQPRQEGGLRMLTLAKGQVILSRRRREMTAWKTRATCQLLGFFGKSPHFGTYECNSVSVTCSLPIFSSCIP